MTLLIAGMVVFFGMHLARVLAPGLRDAGIAKFGTLGWKALYSVVSLAGFALLLYGYAVTRWTSPQLWEPAPAWVRMAVAFAMLPVLVVFVAAYVPGKMRATFRHPMVLATAAWAALHLLVNGRGADLLLFGGFLAWSVLLVVASFRRRPVAAAKPPALAWDAVAIAAGAAAWWWLAFGGGHVLLFGTPVIRTG